MRQVGLISAALLIFSCGQASPPAAARSPSPSPTSVATTSPASTPTPGPPPSELGLLLSAGTLDLISANGTIAASASVAAPSVQFCQQGMGAVLQPPASATSTQVYFRDGDTKIRSVAPDGHTGDVTTVPGGPTTISFFSVSPDDQRIAVLVEDLSGANTIGLRLYVEDLHGAGHHADIYTTSTPKGNGGTTLWPMGWHQGALVLAVVVACTLEPAGLSPSGWHVSNATTANRMATIGGTDCISSYWPSPAGVACVNTTKVQAGTYDWTGKLISTIQTQANDYQSSLSPSGRSIFFAVGTGIGAAPPATRVVGAGVAGSVPGHSACLWIDENHLLAPDAVITLPSGVVTPLPASGICAGRFPGGL